MAAKHIFYRDGKIRLKGFGLVRNFAYAPTLKIAFSMILVAGIGQSVNHQP